MVRGGTAARGSASKSSSQSTVTVRADSSSATSPSTATSNSQRPSPVGTANTTDTDPVTDPITLPSANPAPQSLRQKLVAAAQSPKSRKRKRPTRKNSEEGEEVGKEESTLQRKLDRLIRWNCFLHFTNALWESVAKECYGDAFDIDSDTGQGTRLKIFDCVKGNKNKTLNHMEEHVKEIMKAPEHATAKTLYNTRPLLMDFFAKVFTPGNFFAVWRYMEGYLEYEGSTELGQYYIKSIYINLAIEVKLYVDTCEAGKGTLDARDRLLKFYDQIPVHPNFGEVDKSDFKELKRRYRNQHGTATEKSDRILEECFTSIGAPPPKKQTRDVHVVEGDAEVDAEGDIDV